jgi:hypothetical protein
MDSSNNVLDIRIQIKNMLEKTEMQELEINVKHASSLHQANIIIAYIFHIFQSIGIMTTTVAAGYGRNEFIWLGIGLNAIASLFHVIEKQNESLHKKLIKDIDSARLRIDQYEMTTPTLSNTLSNTLLNNNVKKKYVPIVKIDPNDDNYIAKRNNEEEEEDEDEHEDEDEYEEQ